MRASLLMFLLMCLTYAAYSRSGGFWVKGNTHTHTTESDGDSPPEAVIEWYKSQGYNFLALSDHNVLGDPTKYETIPTDDFLLIPGEEVSANFQGAPVDINGLAMREVVKPVPGESLVDTIQRNVDAILDMEGLPHINHPNFGYAFGHRELLQVKRCNLLEIYNGHPHVNNAGNTAHLPVEQVWDVLLSGGKEVYGLAVDDAHHFKEFGLGRANPRQGWIVVRVKALNQTEVLENIRMGNFYASTGVELSNYAFDGSTTGLSIKPLDDSRYITLHRASRADTFRDRRTGNHVQTDRQPLGSIRASQDHLKRRDCCVDAAGEEGLIPVRAKPEKGVWFASPAAFVSTRPPSPACAVRFRQIALDGVV